MTPAARAAFALPEFGVTAGKLAGLADSLPGADNLHREFLRRIATEMQAGAPSLTQASLLTMSALYDLAKTGELVETPETWLLLGCLTLIEHEKMRLAGGVAIAPAGTRPS